MLWPRRTNRMATLDVLNFPIASKASAEKQYCSQESCGCSTARDTYSLSCTGLTSALSCAGTTAVYTGMCDMFKQYTYFSLNASCTTTSCTSNTSLTAAVYAKDLPGFAVPSVTLLTVTEPNVVPNIEVSPSCSVWNKAAWPASAAALSALVNATVFSTTADPEVTLLTVTFTRALILANILAPRTVSNCSTQHIVQPETCNSTN